MAVRYSSDGEIALLSIDHPPVNAINHDVRSGLQSGMARAGSDPAVRAVVIMCAGSTFSAGADIGEFGTPDEAREPRLPDLLRSIEVSPKPVIAAIHGTALGGGLELALCCHWRIARKDAKIGLPDVKLGLIPGAGGTQRLPRLAGPETALEIVISGRQFDAQFAIAHGIIDELAEGDLLTVARDLARRVLIEKRPLRVSRRLIEKIRQVDTRLFGEFRNKMEHKARGQLAPWKCIEAVEIACSKSFEAGEKFEQEAFEQCLDSPQHKALSYQFRAEREARKIPGISRGVSPLPIRSAAVVGAGTMGGGIAMCLAGAGIPVQLIERADDALHRGLGIIETNYSTSVARGSLAKTAAESARTLIFPGTDYASVSGVDIVIEAVFEDMELKKEIFRKLDHFAGPHAILGSNTSSLDIDALAAATGRPEKVIGTHFFSPANVMKLLENVRGVRTSPETIVTVMTLGRAIGKIPVLAGNCDGFIGNRMLQFYTGGAEYLLEEGATPEQIDRAAEEFGMPMGPLAMRDLAGNDVGLAIRRARARNLPKEERLSPILERIVDQGRLGQKSGAGFYRYEGRERIVDPAVIDLIMQVSKELGIRRRQIGDEEILARLFHPLVNEGARVLEDGIAIRAGDIDVVHVNGYGFPAWRGGPMYWAESIGLEKVRETTIRLGEKFGPRWRSAALLDRLIRDNRGWPTPDH
ncbi:MAG: 3-hydroxyacyl-CoA dehydrogenase NAD-binding domain-containing protein [Gammaproteobacteria bacterium]